MAVVGLGEDKNGFTFYWKIKYFSLCSLLKDNIESPVFRVEEIDNTEWKLILYPDEESNVVLNIKRQYEDEGPKYIYVDIKLFLLKTNNEKVVKEIENANFEETSSLIKPLEEKKNSIFENKTYLFPDDTLTVGCFIKKHTDNVSASTECTAYTEISAEKFSLAFPFYVSRQELRKTISKPLVSKKYPIFEILIGSICSSNASEFMTLKIVMEKWSSCVLCKCKLSVEDEKNETVFLFEDCHKYLASTDDQTWNLTKSVKLVEGVPNMTKDCSFTLRCVIVLSDGTYSSYIKDLVYPVSSLQIKQMDFPNILTKQSHMQKLKCLMEDCSLCDFTIQVDGEDFQIHKAVLGAVSPVFCAMFKQEMKEKRNSVSVIEGVDADTMRKLIHFAYSESVEDLNWERAIKLYRAADKYQISELKQFCALFLIANLTIENVTEVLTFSDTYQDSNLEKEAGDFVFAHANEVLRSENWKTFIESRMTVAIKMMQNMCLKFTSNPSF